MKNLKNCLLLCGILLLSSGCAISMRTKNVNKDLFANPHVLEKRIAALPLNTGLQEESVFNRLTIDPDKGSQEPNSKKATQIKERCGRVFADVIHAGLYPNAQVLGNPAEME